MPKPTKKLVRRKADLTPPDGLPIELLVEFCRALIREHPNSDCLYLSLAAAQRATGATDEQMALLQKAVLHEAQQSWLPSGFM